MTIRKFYYDGAVPDRIKRFAELLVGKSLGDADIYIQQAKFPCQMCQGYVGVDNAWLAPWDGSDEWFVSFWC